MWWHSTHWSLRCNLVPDLTPSLETACGSGNEQHENPGNAEPCIPLVSPAIETCHITILYQVYMAAWSLWCSQVKRKHCLNLWKRTYRHSGTCRNIPTLMALSVVRELCLTAFCVQVFIIVLILCCQWDYNGEFFSKDYGSTTCSEIVPSAGREHNLSFLHMRVTS